MKSSRFQEAYTSQAASRIIRTKLRKGLKLSLSRFHFTPKNGNCGSLKEMLHSDETNDALLRC